MPSVRRPSGAAPPAEPRLPRGKDMDHHPFPNLHYAPFDGDLFVGGPAARDVGQGDLGDCFFLSSLVAVAATRPEVIKRAISKNVDGSYTVTFQEKTRAGFRPVPVRVDAELPVDSSG